MTRVSVAVCVVACGLALSSAAVARGTASWMNGAGGAWNAGANWSTGTPPTAGDDAVIALGGSGPYTITLSTNASAASLTFGSPNATLLHTAGTLELGGGALTLSGGTYLLTQGATLSNAVITGGPFVSPSLASGFNGGTLSNVTLDTHLTIDRTLTMSVANGLTINAGKTVLLDEGARLDFLGAGDQELRGTGEVLFGGSVSGGQVRATAGRLVIGAGATVRSAIRGGQVGQTGELLNLGTIRSGVSGRTVGVGNPTGVWANGASGLLHATSNGTLNTFGTWTNEGIARVDSGVFKFGGDWTNTGVLEVSGSGIMELGGAFGTSSVAPGRWNRTGGQVRITGTLNNTGQTFDVNAMTGSVSLVSGTIDGGVVRVSGGAELSVPQFGILKGGVTLDASLTVPAGAHLSVSNGLTLAPGSVISIESSVSTNGRVGLDNFGDQTISGGGEIVFNGTGGLSELFAISGTLIIGPGVTVRSGTQNGVIGQFGLARNFGTIVAGTSGKHISLTQSFQDNTGAMVAENGGRLLFARGGGLVSNTGTLTARTGGDLYYASGLNGVANGPITLEISSGSSGGHGKVNVQGNSTLSASHLNVVLTGGFQPSWGHSFTLVTYGSQSGNLSSIALPALTDPSLRWWTVQGTSAFTVGVRAIADTNHDGVVDFADLNNVLSTFGQSGAGLIGDADGDGTVSFADLNHVLSNYGALAP